MRSLTRTGKNDHHRLEGLLRQSELGRLASYMLNGCAATRVVGHQAIANSAA
jgi:hypothetical protein